MIFIIDIAKNIKDELDNSSKKIYARLGAYHNEFGIGISDAEISKDSIAFLLETSVKAFELNEDRDEGLSIDISININSLPENNYLKSFNINIDFMKSNGVILETKEFTIDPYEKDEISQIIVTDILNYIKFLSTKLENKLLSDYLDRKKI